MTLLTEKEEIEKPKIKQKRNTLKIVISIILVVAIATGCTIFGINQKHKPICKYNDFVIATQLVSSKMNIDELWDTNSFINTHYFENQDIIQYNAKTNLGNSNLSVFFFNDGEEIYSYFTDVTQENFNSAESILKCITQSACNYYFSDIDQVFDNEAVYPKALLKEPFDSFFTDLLKRTDIYNSDIKNGTQITTKYIPMTNNDLIVVFYIVERSNGDNTIYDLAIDIERQ